MSEYIEEVEVQDLGAMELVINGERSGILRTKEGKTVKVNRVDYEITAHFTLTTDGGIAYPYAPVMWRPEKNDYGTSAPALHELKCRMTAFLKEFANLNSDAFAEAKKNEMKRNLEKVEKEIEAKKEELEALKTKREKLKADIAIS